MFANYHTHTCYSDGKNTPEEVIEEALSLGLDTLGFSDHSYTPFDLTYCMTEGSTREYVKHIRSLQKQYAGKLRILLGIEEDYFSGLPKEDFDYVIGSVHYMKYKGEYYPIDHREYMTRALLEEYGDPQAFLSDYYSLIGSIYEATHCQIVGHFDVITKFNRDGHLFDQKADWYRPLIEKTIDQMKGHPTVLEMNTGGISRGFQDRPYPDSETLSYCTKKGIPFVFGSDSHAKETLCFGYSYFKEALEKGLIKEYLL